jgi:hypothetical protein
MRTMADVKTCLAIEGHQWDGRVVRSGLLDFLSRAVFDALELDPAAPKWEMDKDHQAHVYSIIHASNLTEEVVYRFSARAESAAAHSELVQWLVASGVASRYDVPDRKDSDGAALVLYDVTLPRWAAYFRALAERVLGEATEAAPSGAVSKKKRAAQTRERKARMARASRLKGIAALLAPLDASRPRQVPTDLPPAYTDDAEDAPSTPDGDAEQAQEEKSDSPDAMQ